jgi:hypothetical protein
MTIDEDGRMFEGRGDAMEKASSKPAVTEQARRLAKLSHQRDHGFR